MIKWIKRQIRTWKLTKLMLDDIKEIYGDVNYHAYTQYIQTKKFRRAKSLNDLDI